jgi:hypothetical protein
VPCQIFYINLLMFFKRLFYNVLYEVNKVLQDNSVGIGTFTNKVHITFFHNLTSKLARSTLTSPRAIKKIKT